MKFIFKYIQETLKSGKISKPIFPYNLALLMLFRRFDKLSAAKSTNTTFFESEEVITKEEQIVKEAEIHLTSWFAFENSGGSQ